MTKKWIGTLSVGVALAVPALVVAQQSGIAPFADNEQLTASRLNQLVSALEALDFGAPAFVEAVGGNVTGGPTTRVFTAQSPGTLLLVPGGTGFVSIALDVTGTPNAGPDVLARSRGGSSVSLPLGTGQAVTLSFSNAVDQTPNVNVYFQSLSGGAPPVASN